MALVVAQEVPTSSSMAVPHGPAGVGEARHRMREQLRTGGVAESVIDDAVLILSELLSNACRHGRPLGGALAGDGDVRAAWRVDSAGRLTVEVTDGGGPTRPVPATPSVTAHGGRGLNIITALADDWGVRDDIRGEVTVWVVVQDERRDRARRRDDFAHPRHGSVGPRDTRPGPRRTRSTTWTKAPAGTSNARRFRDSSVRCPQGPVGRAYERLGSRPYETSRNRETPTMAKKRPQTKAKRPQTTGGARAAGADGHVPVVGAREPCPCGSGRRYKACHGRAAAQAVTELVQRPFEGLPGECDWVALRELVPAATVELTLKDGPPGGRPVGHARHRPADGVARAAPRRRLGAARPAERHGVR